MLLLLGRRMRLFLLLINRPMLLDRVDGDTHIWNSISGHVVQLNVLHARLVCFHVQICLLQLDRW